MRFTTSMLALAIVATACGSNSNDPSTDNRADSVASTALANSQDGSMEVLQYALGETVGGTQSPAAQVALTGCEQVDIVRWHLTGTVDLDAGPTQGWLEFATDAPIPPTPFSVDITHSGSFSIEVPATGLSDLASICRLSYPDRDDTHRSTESSATPFDGIFIWDAEPNTVAALGVGLVPGERFDPRRAWAEQFWFGEDLPFDQILAVDRTLVGVPVVMEVIWSQIDRSPCRDVTLVFQRATIIQSQSCTTSDRAGVPVVVDARWQQFDHLSGLVFESDGRGFLIGSSQGWDIAIVAGSTGDIVELASVLRFYDNGPITVPVNVDSDYPLSEDDLVDEIIGVEFREVGRVDTDEGRFLVTEGPLNPENPSDYLRQLRIYLLTVQGRYWNPVLAAGGPWDRCLGAPALGEDRTFLITGDSGATVELSDGADLGGVEGVGRIKLAGGAFSIDMLRIRIDGELIICTAPIVTTLPSVVPTTTGTIPTTDDTRPGGTTDTTSP